MYISHRILRLTAWCIAVNALGVAINCAAQTSAATSAASSITLEKPIYASTNERDDALLAKAFTAIAKTDELQWLKTPDEKFLTLYKAGETRKQKGVLLIMHAPERPQLWPANLENLRRNLTLYGWATMALPLPAKYPGSIPTRDAISTAKSGESSASASSTSSAADNSTSAGSSSSSSETQKPLIARDKLIGDKVNAATTQITKLNQSTVIALVDNSSAPDTLAELYKNINKTGALNGPLKGLILVNLQYQEPLTREQLSAIFSVNNLPVMDVFFSPENSPEIELRRLHQAEAMRQNVKDYQQLVLPTERPTNIDDKQSFWLGRVHGFAEKAIEDKTSSRSSSSTNNGNAR